MELSALHQQSGSTTVNIIIFQRRRRKFGNLGGGGGDDEDSDTSGSGLRIKPTFGVSFGLPQGGGHYPISPYGPDPNINPYGGSFGSADGLNLGLVNVNPLVSLQVSKDDEGEKVLKPFVNLHLTPNPGLVHKFGSLVHNLKGYGHGYGHGHGGYGYPPVQHQHYHQHQYRPTPPPYYSRPYPSYGHGPHIKPIYESYPSYAPSFTRYRTEPPYDNSLYNYEPSGSNIGEYPSSGPGGYDPSLGYGLTNDEPSGYDNSDDYFRNSKSLPLTPNNGQNNQPQNDDTQTQGNSNFAFRDNGAASKSYTQQPEQQKQNTVAFPSDRRSSNTDAVSFEGQSRQKRDAGGEAATEKQDGLVEVQKVS